MILGLWILLGTLVFILWLRVGRLERRVTALENPEAQYRIQWRVGTPEEE